MMAVPPDQLETWTAPVLTDKTLDEILAWPGRRPAPDSPPPGPTDAVLIRREPPTALG
jgi:hypothetical protein